MVSKKINEINADFLHGKERKSKSLAGIDKSSVKRFFNRQKIFKNR